MAESHTEPSDKLYLMIALSLGILTIVSYVSDLVGMPRSALVVVVLVVAVIKASLVAAFFMHLKVDWTKVKVLIIPALLLAVVLVCALLPDITFALRGSASIRPVQPGKVAATQAPDH